MHFWTLSIIVYWIYLYGSIHCNKSSMTICFLQMTLALLTDTIIRGPWPLYTWLIDCLTLSTCRGPGGKRHVVLVTHLSLSIHSLVRVLAEERGEDMWGYTDTNTVTYTPKQTRLPSLHIIITCTPTHLHQKAPIWRVPFRPLRTDQAQLGLERSWGSKGSDWADSERAQHRVTGHSQQPWRCERSWVIVSPRCVGRIGFQKAAGASERHRFIDTELSPGPQPEVITQNMSMPVEAWPPYFISTLSPCRLK